MHTNNVIARRAMPDVAISYYGRTLSTYIVCRQRGDSHVTPFLGMTHRELTFIVCRQRGDSHVATFLGMTHRVQSAEGETQHLSNSVI